MFWLLASPGRNTCSSPSTRMPYENQDLQLLSDVVEAFLRLAAYHISNDPHAVEIRRRLNVKDAFFAKLHQEFESLAEIVISRNIHLPFPRAVLEPVLKLLESRFIGGFRVC